MLVDDLIALKKYFLGVTSIVSEHKNDNRYNRLKVTACNQRILLFVRYPQKGRVKTRLETHLDQSDIRTLYRHFVEDILATLRKTDYPVTVCYLPSEKEAQIKAWLGPSLTYRPQKGVDLGERMGNAFGQAFSVAAPPVDQAVLIGSDFPDLDPGIIQQAFDALSRNDAALGPAFDGGYYLIGFNRHAFAKEIFDGVSWGTGQVFAETVQKVERAGLKMHVLPAWRDIDTYADLKIFYKKAEQKGLSGLKTLVCLEKMMKDA
jgi:rSAM/selenodomain-associated transferase 1